MAETTEEMAVRLLGDARSYQQMITDALKSTASLSAGIGDGSKNVAKLGESLQRMGNTATSVLGGLAAQLGFSGIIGTIQNAIGKAADTESIEMAFKSLVGNADLAKSTLDDLRQFAVSTPFEMPQILEAAKSMIAYGQSAETIVPTMQQLGDVASALNIPLSSLTYLYGTLKSSGRVMTVDMRQFANRGIPIWIETAKVIGMVSKETKQLTGSQSAQLQEMVTKGKITFPMIEQAFKNMTSEGGRFFNMMEDQSKTFWGIVSNLKDSVGLLMADIGKEIIEGFDLKTVLQNVRDASQAFVDWFKAISPGTKRLVFTLLGIVGAIGGVVAAIAAVKAALVVLGVVFGAVSGPWLLVIGAIATAVGLWVNEMGGIGAAFEAVKAKAFEFWEYIKPIREALAGIWAALAFQATRAWEAVKTMAANAWAWISSTFSVNWDYVRDQIANGLLFVEFAINNVEKVWDYAWKGMRYAALFALNKVLENIVYIMGAPILLPIFLAMQVNWQELWDNIKDYMVGTIAVMATKLGQFGTSIPQILAGGAAAIGVALGNLWQGLDISADDFRWTGGGIEIKALKELEDQWRKEWEESGDALNVSFEEFKKNRETQLKEAGQLPGKEPPKPIPPPVDEGKWKSAANTIKSVDQVLRASTEGLARIIDYRERLMGKQQGGAGAASAGGGGLTPPGYGAGGLGSPGAFGGAPAVSPEPARVNVAAANAEDPGVVANLLSEILRGMREEAARSAKIRVHAPGL